MISSLITLFIFSLIFLFCGYVIKRRWIDKKSIPGGIQFTSEHVYKQFQNKQKQRAMEHVHYLKEDEEQENDESEDINRFK